MSQSNLTRKRLNRKQIAACRKVAKSNGMTFVYVGPGGVPGNALTGWFDGPDYGDHYTRQRRQAVEKELAELGVEL